MDILSIGKQIQLNNEYRYHEGTRIKYKRVDVVPKYGT